LKLNLEVLKMIPKRSTFLKTCSESCSENFPFLFKTEKTGTKFKIYVVLGIVLTSCDDIICVYTNLSTPHQIFRNESQVERVKSSPVEHPCIISYYLGSQA
jgi:hypothetical protein